MEMRRRWTNAHRYRSDAALWSWLKDHGVEPRGQDSRKWLEASARAILDAMRIIVEEGVLAWERRR
jgi:hypothetical protein